MSAIELAAKYLDLLNDDYFSYFEMKGIYSNADFLVYKDPDLQKHHVQLLFSLDSYKMNIYASVYFGYETNSKVRLATNRVSHVKVDTPEVTAGRIGKAAKRIKKDIIRGKIRLYYGHTYQKLDTVHGYLLGIQERINSIFELSPEHQTIVSQESTCSSKAGPMSTLHIRKGSTVKIRLLNDTFELFFTVSAKARQSALLDDVLQLREYGAKVTEFSYQPGGTIALEVNMNIETEYDEEIFHIIKNGRVYNQQIANEITELRNK